ncbi:hypothetical protein CMO92_01485 [Candidatus Woesearchaeota archaeon]|nr:hypothetical protein [Candidatus Woesearchaeota archaeon]
MFITDFITKVESSESYKEFIKNHPDYYLVHLFCMQPDENWQAGYYSEKEDKIVIFSGTPVMNSTEEDSFKKQGIIHPLPINEITIDADKAIQLAEQAKNTKHSAETINKKIIILQIIEQPVWNITLISDSFSMINIRIHAKTGETLRIKADSILSLGKK